MPLPQVITLHWTAGQYIPNSIDQKDYHGVIGKSTKTKDFTYIKLHNYHETLSHCWHENTGNIGISICGMLNATEYNFGTYLITTEQLEIMYQAVAEICTLKNIPVEKVKTHGERAITMGYGVGSNDPQIRWDLGILQAIVLPLKLTPELVVKTGSFLRKKIAEKMKGLIWKYHNSSGKW